MGARPVPPALPAPPAGPDGRVRYFAYGSNLHRPQMAALAPSAVVETPARLTGWELFVTNDGVLSIRPAAAADPTAEVLGLVWRCTPADLATLDRFEAVDEGLYVRTLVTVTVTDTAEPAGPTGAVGPAGPADATGGFEAVVYTAVSGREGRPRPGYLELSVLPPMRELGFPAGYVGQVESWLVAGTAGPAWLATPEPGAVFTTPPDQA